MGTIKRSEVTNLRMVAGNEKKHTHVIEDGMLKQWVGIGWITVRQATDEDFKNHPTLEN